MMHGSGGGGGGGGGGGSGGGGSAGGSIAAGSARSVGASRYDNVYYISVCRTSLGLITFSS